MSRMMEDSALRVDLSPAKVVTMYFLTSSNERLKPNLEKYLKPGARVVSNQFPIRGWKPPEVVHVKTGPMEHTIYVYEMGQPQVSAAALLRSPILDDAAAPGNSRSSHCSAPLRSRPL